METLKNKVGNRIDSFNYLPWEDNSNKSNKKQEKEKEAPGQQFKPNISLNPNKKSEIFIFGKLINSKSDFGQIRKNIGILGRFPIMFTGSVRSNIDPDSEYTDSEIIKVLHFLKIIECMNKNGLTGGGGVDTTSGGIHANINERSRLSAHYSPNKKE